VSYHPSSGNRRPRRSAVLKLDRGSHKRVNRIRWQQHTPLDFRIFVLVLLVALIALAVSLRGSARSADLTPSSCVMVNRR
jgi:hypothetical protein